MSDVKRYDPANAWGQAYMRVEAFGRWVAYKDYAALRARLAEVKKERDAKISPDQVQDLVDLAEPMLSNALGEAEGEIAALQARLEELEANINIKADFIDAKINQLAASDQRIEELEAELRHQTDLIEQFFALLDKTEETDDGIVFHPNQLRSCRASDTEKLGKLLAKLKASDDVIQNLRDKGKQL